MIHIHGQAHTDEQRFRNKKELKHSYLYMALLYGTANKCRYSKIYERTYMVSKIKAQTDWKTSH